LTDCRR